ncbi:MAG: phosphomannomutase/phosphoglucomutase [Candidatus Doudnabacteria bacterium]|nr:phosphomannomutase/phosphoglucomutase [Candidatus Doudnabacteria bacterium]
MAILNKYMFREYDIRGRETEQELNPRSVELIAKAYGTFLRKRNVRIAVVGHDNRGTSEDFYAAAVRGLVSAGIRVIGIGTALTPMMYWAQYYFQSEGGLMVTASHNPAGWNGVKLALGYSYTLMREELLEIYEIIERESFSTGVGTFEQKDIFTQWRTDLLSRVKLVRPLRIVLNTGNGTAGLFTPQLLREFGCEVVEQNTEPDSTYPHYVPNPANVEMMEDLGRRVVEAGADIGIAIDADGDRLGVCDERGGLVWPDRWLVLLARQVLSVRPGAAIVFDVKCSEALREDVIAHGGAPVMAATGHAYMKQKMKEVGAVFAGEQSGHVYIGDGYYGYDDASFAALRVLEFIAAHSVSVSQLLADIPQYVTTPAYHMAASDERKYEIVKQIAAEFKQEGYRMDELSGARVYMDEGWGLIRASSNTPQIEVRFESKTQRGLEYIESVFRQKIAQFSEVGTEWGSS